MKDDMWTGFGIAAVIIALCLGIGGCSYLTQKGAAARIAAEQKTKP